MSRRATFMLIGILLSLAIGGLPQIGFAQTDPMLGLPTPLYKSMTAYVQGEGQNRKSTVVGIDAAGNPLSIAFLEPLKMGSPIQ